MCFVACHKQSLPAHYIYSMSCYSCHALNSEETEFVHVFSRVINWWQRRAGILQTVQSCFGAFHPQQIKANSNLFRGF